MTAGALSPADTRPREAPYRIALSGLAVFFFATACLWALILPPFSGPDEISHYNSVVRVMTGGGWPAPYEARITDATITAVAESGGEFLDQRLAELPQPADRSLVGQGTEWDRSARDQMVQHPPAYYYLIGKVLALLGGDQLRWDSAQLAMRAMSALVFAAAIPFVAGAARWVVGSRRAGIVGAGLLLLVPFFTNGGGFITNDSLLILTCSAALYFAVRSTTARPPAALVLLVLSGAALGAALLTKGLALMLIPVIATLGIMAAWRSFAGWKRLLVALVPMGVAFVVGGWWWLRNLLVLGKLQPSQLGDRESRETPIDGYDPLMFLGNFFVRLNRTFWGRGGREDMAFPALIPDVAGVVFVVLLIVAFVVARRRGILAILWAFPVLVLVTLIGNAHSVYWDLGDPSRGVQGRYLFAGIVAFAATFAVLFYAATRRASDRWRRWASAIVVTAAAGTTWVAAIWLFFRLWGDGSAPLRAALDAHGVSALAPEGAALTAAAGLVAVVLVLLSRKRSRAAA